MPEGLEAEIWRRDATRLVGRRISDAWVDGRVAPPDFADRVRGTTISGVRRRGKVVLIDLEAGNEPLRPSQIGLHFGMTGRLVVDGDASIERLEYASELDRDEWDRLKLWTDDATVDDEPAARVNDPRRLGRTSLDPDLTDLGPDMFALDADLLAERLACRRAAIKPLLLDQSIVAGLGNLCADDVLFVAGVSPLRPSDELAPDDLCRIADACCDHLPVLLARGGSTHGYLDPETRSGPGHCALDGSELVRAAIRGRTAVWCPQHQR